MKNDSLYVKRNGKVTGPATRVQLSKLHMGSKLNATDLIAQSVDGPWHKLEDVEAKLFPESAHAQPSPPKASAIRDNLVECVDCGSRVSKRASACPQCGSPTGGLGQSSGATGSSIESPRDRSTLAAEKFCSSCGTPHSLNQAVCLKCGVALGGSSHSVASGAAGKNKIVAGILAITLGGLGAHKFYHGSWGFGLIYIVCILTFIPGIVGLVEGIIYLTMQEDEYNAKYNVTPPNPFKW